MTKLDIHTGDKTSSKITSFFSSVFPQDWPLFSLLCFLSAAIHRMICIFLIGINNMFKDSLLAFRKSQNLTVREFSAISDISVDQINRYSSSRLHELQTKDALYLMTAFPDIITIPYLLQMNDLDPIDMCLLPRFYRKKESGNPVSTAESNVCFQTFIDTTGKTFYSNFDFLPIKYSLVVHYQIFEDDFASQYNVLDYIDDDCMCSFMQKLKEFNKLQLSHLPGIYPNTAQNHFNRKTEISSFASICAYEKLFNSHGLYLVLELLNCAYRHDLSLLMDCVPCLDNSRPASEP